jgi:biopolymer transport protein ExbB/TolQ
MFDRAKLSSYLSDPSLLLAVPATGIYYAIMFQPEMHDTLLAKYTTEHMIEYVIVGMFMWGMVDVVLKLLTFPREFLALRQTWFPPRSGRVPVTAAAELLADVEEKPAAMLESRLGLRITHALTFLIETKSAEEFPEQLRYLSEQDHETTHNKYSLVGFIVAVTPILGFLGTVIHFGTALSGMTVDNMATQLNHVVSEMGTAFNTTTVALGAAMLTMFGKFLTERADRGIDNRIDRIVERELLNRFEVKAANLSPLLATLDAANREFHAAVQGALAGQVTSWTAALEALFERFEQRQQIEEQRWEKVCDKLAERYTKHESSANDNLKKILLVADERHDQHLGQIQLVLEQAAGFSTHAEALASTLNGIAQGEGQLADVQKSLSNNLKLLHETHQIDDALHGLTAAIHLLTARNTPSPAAKKAA